MPGNCRIGFDRKPDNLPDDYPSTPPSLSDALSSSRLQSQSPSTIQNSSPLPMEPLDLKKKKNQNALYIPPHRHREQSSQETSHTRRHASLDGNVSSDTEGPKATKRPPPKGLFTPPNQKKVRTKEQHSQILNRLSNRRDTSGNAL